MNKDTERLYFDAFSKLRADLALTDVRGCERPDFVCSVGGIITGIEMTRFFFPASGPLPPQAVNGYRDQVSRALQEEHTRRGLAPLHASVHLFWEEKLLTLASRKTLVTSLIDFVAQNIPPVGPHVEFDALPTILTDLGVDVISVIRAATLARPSWSLPYASFIPDSHSSLVQAIVTEKSTLAPEYRKKAAALWLLIVSGSNGIHSIVNFDGDVLSALYMSAFDRIFLFRTFGPSVHELKRV